MPEERCGGGRARPVEADGERSCARTHPVRLAQPMMRGLLVLALLCAGTGAVACPLCLGAFQQSKAQELVSAPHAVLAAPTADPSRFRVIAVVKGERPASSTVEGAYPRNGPAYESAASGSGKLLLLVRDDLFPTWTILGRIGADHLDWLRKLAVEKPAAEMSLDDWRARAALALPYLESHEPLAAEFAYGELAEVPYPALRTVKSHLAAPAVRQWIAQPERTARQPLYFLLLGIAGNAEDAASLERRLEKAWASSDATNVGPMIAADLELKGPTLMAWVDERYMRDQRRSTRELEAALLALSVQGNANGVIPRERVIQSYRTFIKEHRDIAGFVAQDLAAWQYWDAVPEYLTLLKSSTPQQYPSRIAIAAYLRQSPNASAIVLPADLAPAASAVGALPK